MKIADIPNLEDTPENRELFKTVVMKTLDVVLERVSQIRQISGGHGGKMTLACDAVSVAIGVIKNETDSDCRTIRAIEEAMPFRKFKAAIRGVEIGSSVLSKEWSGHAVLSQLRVDGCPIGEGCTIVGWPHPEFKVVRADGVEVEFTLAQVTW